ncbi:MAG: hypothetical protein KJ650_09185 [Firmicutes bacterium]|nr:hypothetical protein [Bacillota bacterium]MBV1727178.1 hypothetical protein [Desulforudis sp.]MBU4533782.1 hypothetical protein [Bacillota bacterium]MBU4553617.1 hypothetical protein [Bacillota bacterium]MBV1735562.1 hypothetical protein [Desulforudis sp.]
MPIRLCACLLVGILVLLMPNSVYTVPAGAVSAQESTAQEEALVAELLDINLELMRLRQVREAQEENLAEIRGRIRSEQVELAHSEERLRDARARLAVWLRYNYENGRWSYLELLLNTRSFGELISRIEMLQVLMVHEAKLVHEVRRLNAEIRESLAQLGSLYGEAQTEERLIAAQMRDIEQTKAKRVAFLNEIRKQSAEMADRMIRMEDEWQVSLAPLQGVLKQLSHLLVSELKPDRIRFEGLKVRLEVSDASVNKAIRSANQKPGDKLSVSLVRDAILINGTNAAQKAEFTLSGRLVPTHDGSTVNFSPQSLTINGTAIKAELLPVLSREGSLSFSLGQSFKAFGITDIIHEPDKVTVTLSRG